MTLIRITYELAHAAATDAGNASMRKAGRTRWNEDAHAAMCAEFNRLWPERGRHREG